MPNSRFYSSIAAVTNLQVTANPSDLSIQVASSSGWPGSFPYIISLDYGAANEELVLVTSGGPNVFTVTRAYDGTSASTHNAGAVVRHVSSAIDFTDSRTHEASTTGVHGISGSFVDTTSVQTMTNKTLTAPIINNPTVGGTVTATGATITGATFTSSVLTNPTINAATLTGTLAGTPTFSGAYVSTGGPSFTTAAPTFSRTNSGDVALQTKRTADTNPTLAVYSTGTMQWGSGSGAGDTSLGRTGVGALSLTGSLAASSDITSSGDITWTGVPWSTYSVSWTASTTNPVLGIGGTLVGRYKLYGKTCVLDIKITPGSGGGFSRGTGNYAVSLPVQAANQQQEFVGGFHILGTASKGRYIGQSIISPNATTMGGFIPEVSAGTATGKAVFWQHDTPFAVDPGDQFRFTIVYETV